MYVSLDFLERDSLVQMQKNVIIKKILKNSSIKFIATKNCCFGYNMAYDANIPKQNSKNNTKTFF